MKNGKILVLGGGKSGIASARFLLDIKKPVILFDSGKKEERKELIESFKGLEGIEFIFEELRDIDLQNVEYAIISPGIPRDLPFVKKIEEKGIEILAEIEIAYRYMKGRLAGVTGTNGKTTTVSLIGEILRTYFKDVHVVGNIGNPFITETLKTSDDSATVVELSSFQLEGIKDFRPNVSAILNITPDHLNRHKTMENYIFCKERICENQKKDDIIVLNYEDALLREFGNDIKDRVKTVFFSSKRVLKEGIYLKDDKIYFSDNETHDLLDVHDLNVLGIHNYENVMCAILVAHYMGVPFKYIIEAVKSFNAVEHRIEFVREKEGVRYYNDSKGTNVDASIKAVLSMPGPVVLIAGGYDKGLSFDELAVIFKDRLKALVLIGQTAEMIKEAAIKFGFTNIYMENDLKSAVEKSSELASSGDYVLLSPACASWGMFKNYEQRGDMFKEYVNSL